MKQGKRLMAVVCVLGAFIAGAAGCKKDKAQSAAKPLVKVRIGAHNNGAGASIAAVAKEKGFFAEYGIDAEITIVQSGPAEMAAMRADSPTLEFGYIGPGVAWNPIDTTGNSLSFIFFDNLGNSEYMIARKGQFKDANGNGKFESAELYDGLKGQTVYFEVGTTPGGWFKNLLDNINAGYADSDKLWIHCDVAAYLAGYTAANSNPANRVLVVNYENANIAAGMGTSGSNAVNIAVAYEPVPSTILKTNKDVERVADINSLSKEKVFPSTWVANTKWMKANPELAKNCVYALYKASNWRTANPAEALRIAERFCGQPEGVFLETVQYFPTREDFKNWFANPNAAGYSYLRSLYNERLPNLPQGVAPKPFEQAFDIEYMLQAIKEL